MRMRERIREAVVGLLRGAEGLPSCPVMARRGKKIDGMIDEALASIGMAFVVWPVRVVRATRTGNFYFAESAELLIQCIERPDTHGFDFAAYDAPDALAEVLLGETLGGLLVGAIEPGAHPETFMEGARGRVVEMRFSMAFEAAVGRRFQELLGEQPPAQQQQGG